MAKREPLGKDPLEWIKRTKPADEEEAQPEQQAEKAQPPQVPEQQATWLDSMAQSEEQTEEPTPETPLAPEPTAQPPAPEAEAAVEDAPPVAETAQAPPPEEGPIQVQAPGPPSPEWPSAVVQQTPTEGQPLPDAIAQPDEEEPTEILGVGGEEEEVTAEKLRAETHYVHVGSTDDEVQTLPKPDSDEYAAVDFPGQERSLLFPIILIVCIFLMGLIVYMWAETRIRGVEQRLTRIEKTLSETQGGGG
ncbi:MAG: hypothetical protein GXP25_01140 [Planctomycetes bacterium]|nr:hypothetical protein [Planctomycetota bacterium]